MVSWSNCYTRWPGCWVCFNKTAPWHSTLWISACH